MNVSSIVVMAKSEDVESLVEVFSNCDFCEYHFHDAELGKIIVTVEGEGVDEEIEMIKHIQQTPKVISADMMMAYSEDELDRERDKVDMSNEIPKMLNDDSIDAKDIVYYGDIKKKNL